MVTLPCVVDTSALIAIALAEPGATALCDRLLTADARFIGAPSVLEAEIVLAQRVPNAPMSAIADLLAALDIEEIPLTPVMRQHAFAAWLAFGKGRHAAGLNYGDCLSYGVAGALALPLLFVGNDFSRTDVRVAL